MRLRAWSHVKLGLVILLQGLLRGMTRTKSDSPNRWSQVHKRAWQSQVQTQDRLPAPRLHLDPRQTRVTRGRVVQNRKATPAKPSWQRMRLHAWSHVKLGLVMLLQGLLRGMTQQKATQSPSAEMSLTIPCPPMVNSGSTSCTSPARQTSRL